MVSPAGFYRGFTLISVSNMLAKVAVLCFAPFIARIYSPTDVGGAAIVFAIGVALLPLTSVSYESAIVTSKSDAEALSVFTLCVVVLMFALAILTITLLLLSLSTLRLYNQNGIEMWMIIAVPLLVGVNAGYELLYAWATRIKSYGLIAGATSTSAIGGELTKVATGLFAPCAALLVLSQCIGKTVGILCLYASVRKTMPWHLVTQKRASIAALRHVNLPKHRLPAKLLQAIASNSLVLIAAGTLAADQVGNMAMAIAVMVLPFTILGTSAGRVLFAEYARVATGSKDKLRKEFSKALRVLGVIGTALSCVAVFWAPDAFRMLLGNQWQQAGYFAALIAPMLLPQLLGSAMSQALEAAGGSRLFLAQNAVRLIATALIFASHIWATFDPGELILAYSMSMSLFYSWCIMTTWNKLFPRKAHD